MRTHTQKSISFVVSILLVLSFCIHAHAAEFTYTHNPLDDTRVTEDVIEDPGAVYGFSPNPASTRLGSFAQNDWTNIVLVEQAKKERMDYHQRVETELMSILYSMKKRGASIENIARKLSEKRNEIRLKEAADAGTLDQTKQSNLAKYGNENGPTPESLYDKYGSWETVAAKAFSTNIGMDVCLGLYDLYYDTYDTLENLFAIEKNTFTVTPKAKSFKASALKKQTKRFKITVKNSIGKITYKAANTKSKKVFKITSTGIVTVKKGTKVGIYKIKVKDSGNAYYNAVTKTITIKVCAAASQT